ncbi:MAG TPA: hypothetical protein VLG10_02720 [Methylomirabilota bacterium]|nr:hypothetical protein [Methylomirabilota bacterium]
MARNIQPWQHCPRCEEPVERGELVVFDAGDLLHLRCFSESGEISEVVSGFLRRHTPAHFCHTCLSALLHIPYGHARKAITVLRATPGFYIVVGDRCSACRQARVTIQYEVEASTRPWAA